MQSVRNVIAFRDSYALNLEQDVKVSEIVGCSGIVESDADEQVLLQLGFSGNVDLTEVSIVAIPGRLDEAPGVVKLFANVRSVDFADVEQLPATQQFTLTADDYVEGTATLSLFGVKFVKTSSLTIFIERALDSSSDVTAFSSIDVMESGKNGPPLDIPFVAIEADFDQVLRDAASTPVIVDFTASWCGPCKRIKPLFTALATKYQATVKAIKVDVDVNKAVTRRYGVSSYPTFLVFRDGEQVDKVGGADPAKLTELFSKYGSA